MELINCGRCGKLQVQRPDTLCLDCQQIYIAESQAVKEYIKQNPGSSMLDVVRNTGLSIKRINEIVRE
ncbi:hypothetical protein D7Z26_19580 [Cohnella endophytica]|uniref:Flagellar protein n=1 Tax=Cohnella endophytica TaxID=2419778 RepID=A0A494XPF8_9BACL|nr:hypothetical protein [Cohnella endophytica]RKP50019.1 hypothetical protein D7Z26_19580 [Cohnella endophytica]